MDDREWRYKKIDIPYIIPTAIPVSTTTTNATSTVWTGPGYMDFGGNAWKIKT